MSDKKKIYGFNNGGSPGWHHAVAIGEDGAVIDGHICSDEGYMLHDLGIEHSTWKHDSYDKHFGAGNWEIEWVPSDKVKTHPGLLKAIELNKTVGNCKAYIPPGVEITTVDENGKEEVRRYA
jgi:hypothetical protein